MSANLKPGLIALHGNQMEALRSAVFGWLRSNPLGALEEEIILVQSNGIAEWLKIAMAEEIGVCAATRVMLPARFLWEAYRTVLGWDQVPRQSPLDKPALTWRLMHLLPRLLDGEAFAPLKHFLADGDAERRLQLAQRLADLIDQYQVYRADWLNDWAAGLDQLRGPSGAIMPLQADQRWQAQLWRAILAELDEEQRQGGRAAVHQRFIEKLESGEGFSGELPKRVVVFGLSAMPGQMLEALGKLAAHVQVILAVSNPCRYYWGDIIEGRELLRAAQRRHAPRGGRDLSGMPLEELHAHCHPLLAGWGRMGRDFIRMLDEFDNSQSCRENFPALRIDLFTEEEGGSLLSQAQNAIRDLVPLAEHGRLPLAPDDRSVEFHVAHSVQREVEVLHDRLLDMFAATSEQPLRPRDVVVMVPDIEAFAPAIRAVFGQYGLHDARHIPFAVIDIRERRANPLLAALDWLLRLPEQRCMQSEIRDLLDVPAIAQRFRIAGADLPRIGQWIEGAGIRWGLDTDHRDSLGLGAAGEQNAWLFGLRRMLLGYASGDLAAFRGVEPYPEVAGLEAALGGALAGFIRQLMTCRSMLSAAGTPAQWNTRARALLKIFFKATDERDLQTMARLEKALERWLDECHTAGFDQEVPLAVLREAWLGELDEPSRDQRFVSGGVTFCTLMPMRAVPFRVVCMLGMNDGDYPRRARHADFDLLAQAGLARPGDRSRRDDDRYLMLEALLAARDKLYISWVGRNVRDNSEQPCSVLVAQLRDYLQAGWQLDLAEMTVEHPLQPFSRRYFEEDSALLTYAREWRAAHVGDGKADAQLPPFDREAEARLRLDDLASFIKSPVKYFFRSRLQVVFPDRALSGQDDEPFALDNLEDYQLARHLLADDGEQETEDAVATLLQQRAARLARQGVLPVGLAGQQYQQSLVTELAPVRQALLRLRRQFPHVASQLPVTLEFPAARLEDWLDQLRGDGSQTVWVVLEPGKATQGGKGKVARPDKLIHAWVRQLAAAACGIAVTGYLVARDAVLVMPPLNQAHATDTLKSLLAVWEAGMARPLPAACKTALALLEQKNMKEAYEGNRKHAFGDVKDACLARMWPDFAAFSAEPDWEEWARALYGPLAEWAHGHVRIEQLETVAEQKEAA